MIPAEAFWTTTLRASAEGEAITRILEATLAAVDPGEAVRRFASLHGSKLVIPEKTYDLKAFPRVRLLAFGKAALSMTRTMVDVLGEHLDEALAIRKYTKRPDTTVVKVKVIAGSHPIPDKRSLAAGQKVIEFVSASQPEDLLICLISGGASALVAAPVEGVSLEDLQTLTASLLACGARIDEMNTVRRHLDRVKGGRLARLANGATILSLILSDVVGNRLEAIASGPTAPDPTTRQDALKVLKTYGLRSKVPASIWSALEKEEETLKPDDPQLARIQNVIVGSSLQAAQAALRQADTEGFNPYLLQLDMEGEARQVAFELATLLRQSRRTGVPVPRPACIVAGGETTVTLTGGGKGGRNTELALAAACELADFPDVMLVTLATDGEDGPTDAAGAVVSGSTFHRAREKGLDPIRQLNHNDSYTFFYALGDLIKTGPTGTNVNDLVFMFSV